MTRKQRRGFLIGTLLGDSSFAGKKNKHILFGHCAAQKSYGEWKLYLLGKLFSVATNSCLAKGMGDRVFYRFWTVTDHRFTALYKRIVVDGKKHITDYVIKNFDDVALAYLFMDDGCKETVRGKIKSYKISVNSYPLEEVNKLSRHIFEKFGIENRVFLERKKHPTIRISKKEQREKFENVIKKHLHPSLFYKIQQ